jgi:hypothetical protein
MLGGFIYCIMPPMVTEAKAIFQRLAAGAIIGYLYFWALNGAPLEWQIVASIVGTAYWGIDFLKTFLEKFKPKEGLSKEEFSKLDLTTQLALKNLEDATKKDFNKHPVKLGVKEFDKGAGRKLTSLNAGLPESVWPAKGVTMAEQYDHMVKGTPLGKLLVQMFSKEPTDVPSPPPKFGAKHVLPFGIQVLTIPDGDWGDTACRFGQYWNKKLIGDYARSLGFEVIELDGDQAKRTQFEAATAATSYVKGLEGTGHGDSTRYTGYKQEVLLEPANYGNMRNRIGSFLSCQFGKSAQQRLSQGELAEHSYTEDFVFSIDNEKPESDSESKWFFEPHGSYFRAQLDGQLHGPAAYTCIAFWNNYLSKAPYVLQYYMQWDLNAQQFPGDEQAGLGSTPTEKVDKVEFYLNNALVDTQTQPKSGSLYESIQTLTSGSYEWWSVPYYKGVRGQESAHIMFEVEESSTATSKAIAISPKQGDKLPPGQIALQSEATVTKS